MDAVGAVKEPEGLTLAVEEQHGPGGALTMVIR